MPRRKHTETGAARDTGVPQNQRQPHLFPHELDPGAGSAPLSAIRKPQDALARGELISE